MGSEDSLLAPAYGETPQGDGSLAREALARSTVQDYGLQGERGVEFPVLISPPVVSARLEHRGAELPSALLTGAQGVLEALAGNIHDAEAHWQGMSIAKELDTQPRRALGDGHVDRENSVLQAPFAVEAVEDLRRLRACGDLGVGVLLPVNRAEHPRLGEIGEG